MAKLYRLVQWGKIKEKGVQVKAGNNRFEIYYLFGLNLLLLKLKTENIVAK